MAGKSRIIRIGDSLNFSVSLKTLPVTELITQVDSCLSGSKLEPDVADLVTPRPVRLGS